MQQKKDGDFVLQKENIHKEFFEKSAFLNNKIHCSS